MRKVLLSVDEVVGRAFIYPSNSRSLITLHSGFVDHLPIMIIPALFIFLCCRTLVQALHQGDPCRLPNGTTGVCTLLNNCDLLRPELRANPPSSIICKHYPPSVCCPQRSTMRVRSIPKFSRKPRVVKHARIGEISRRKCAEYSKYVFTEKWSAAPLIRRQKISVNQCATKTLKLIVGGTKAEPREFPHMAAIGYNVSKNEIGWHCGGSIISERFILTAAHCTWSIDWGEATWVRVGDLNLMDPNDRAEPKDIRIAETIIHPKYKRPAFYHDIALFRLETDIVFNGWARPACLHTEPTTGTENAVAAGWGNPGYLDETRYDLLKVTLPLVDTKTCDREWRRSSKLPNGIYGKWSICAGTHDRDTCTGDSGGPLVIHSPKQYYCMYDIVGVTSIGKFCGFNVPAVYTRVYHYVPWIESKVWGKG